MNHLKKAPGVQNVLLSLKNSFGVLLITQILFVLIYFKSSQTFEWGIVFGALFFMVMTLSLVHFFSGVLFLWIFPLFDNQKRYASGILSSLIQSFLLTLQVVDLVYFQFTQKHATFDLLRLIQAEDFGALILSFMKDYWWVFLLGGAAYVFLFIYNIRLFNRLETDLDTKKAKKMVFSFAYSLFLLPLFLLLGRGGFQPRPRTILDAHLFVSAENSVYVLNTPFTFLTTLGMEGMPPLKWEGLDVENTLAQKTTGSSPFPLENPNIVLFILESFSAEAMQSFDSLSKPNTPFLDSLSQHAWNYSNAYANGLRSVDALPAIMSGLPSLMEEAYLFSPYAAQNIQGIPQLLPAEYQSLFFHGAQNGSMNFESYCYQVGFDQYHGRNEYQGQESDFDGTWGIFDEPFLQYSLKEMLNTPEPFFASVFTLSSHPPYTVPNQYQHLIQEGDLPIESSIRYTDLSLKRFFEAFKKHPQFKNTIFIITADHVAPELPRKRQDYTRNYWIPIMIYNPIHTPYKKWEHAVQQTDLFRTVLQFANSSEQLTWPYAKAINDTLNPHDIIHYRNLEYTMTRDSNRYYFQAPEQWFTEMNQERKEGLENTTHKHLFQAYLQYYYEYFNTQP